MKTDVLVLACVATAALVGTAVPAHADGRLPSPARTTVSAGHTETTTIDVPAGLLPRRITGDLAVTGAASEDVTVLLGDRPVRTITASPTARISVPVGRADLNADHSLTVGLRMDGGGACGVAAADVSATLTRLALLYTGRPTAPTQVSTFFDDTVRQVTVVVPDDADRSALEAGLVTVGAVSSRYPDTVPVVLQGASDPVASVGPGQRVVRIDPAGGDAGADATTSVGVSDGLATLTIGGGADHLAAAARALGSSALAIASGGSASGLSTPASPAGRTARRSLADLGYRQVVVDSSQTTSSFLNVRQDSFGGSVGSLRLHLEGVHTVVADGTDAQLDVYVNGSLVASSSLDAGTTIDDDVTVPASTLASDNTIELRLTAASGGAGCPPAIPIVVRVDGTSSRIDADLGTVPDHGLQAFPQVLGGHLPVALVSDGSTPVATAAVAATMVAALQRAAAAPLDVSVVAPDTLLDGGQSGLVVGAGETESTRLAAPLRFSQVRLFSSGGLDFSAGVPQPFAAIESVSRDSHDVLVLGSWAPGGSGRSDALMQDTADWAAQRGWSSVGTDLVMADPSGKVVSLSSDAVTPQEAVVDEQRSFVWWLIGGIGVLLLLLALRLVALRRRRRIDDLVLAQLAEDDADARP